MSIQLHKRMKPLLGTFVEIGLNVDSSLHPAFDLAFDTIASIQSLMSFHHPRSELSLINKQPHQWVKVSDETAKVIGHAKQLAKASANLFNPTVGGELIEQRALPNHFCHAFESIGNANDIEIDQQHIRLASPVLITLDGIAKGYAVDQAIKVLREAGIEDGWVNAGGDIRVFGNLKLPIALQPPENKTQEDKAQEQIVACELYNQAIASSQVGQTINEHFPSHIVAPKGKQLSSGLISVIAKEAWLADGLTKVFALANEEERKTFAQTFGVTYYTQPS